MNSFLFSMKKFTSLLPAALLAASFGFAAPTYAQQEDFSPCKGICWGLFYDKSGETLLNYMVPVEYVHPTWDKYIFPNFVECGKDLIAHITDVNDDPDYYDIHLEMDGGLYDDYGYFYAPFTHEPFKWTISAPYGELMGPIYQPGSYYHAPLEYFGLFYVRYPDNDFGYFDIKTQEDYYDDVERTYLTEEEVAEYTGVNSVVSAPLSKTYYDFQGRRVDGKKGGVTIENGRKVIR